MSPTLIKGSFNYLIIYFLLFFAVVLPINNGDFRFLCDDSYRR